MNKALVIQVWEIFTYVAALSVSASGERAGALTFRPPAFCAKRLEPFKVVLAQMCSIGCWGWAQLLVWSQNQELIDQERAAVLQSSQTHLLAPFRAHRPACEPVCGLVVADCTSKPTTSVSRTGMEFQGAISRRFLLRSNCLFSCCKAL